MTPQIDKPKRKAGWSLLPFVGAPGVVVAVWLLCLLLGGCSKPENIWKDARGKRIMASFPPIYCFAANVAGEDGTVHCLMTATGPHDYPLSFADANKLRGAELFFINGLGLDGDLCKRLAANSNNNNLKLIDLGQCPALKDKLLPAGKEEHDEKDGHHHHHHHGDTDPHVWLGIPQAIALTQCIREELVKADPAHSAGYEKRAAAYIARLEKLHADGIKALADKKDRRIVAFHDSLQYFARSFDLKIVDSIEGIAGAEPDTGRFKDLVDRCVRDKVRVIAAEPQYRNTTANALINELKAKGVPDPALVEVDPIETATGELTPDYYERKMRANFENLAKAMR